MTSAFKRRGDERAVQPMLFSPQPQRREGKAPYGAAIYLRALGYTVSRAGENQSRIDGKLYTQRELCALARKKGWMG